MVLEPQDANLYFRLHRSLMVFVNQRLKVVPDNVASPEAFARLAPEVQIKIRDALIARLELIDAFVDENPARLSDEELEIVSSWRHLAAGKFIAFRDLAKYTVFLATSEPPVAYGVVAVSPRMKEFIRMECPKLVTTVLLPFKGRIVFDALLYHHNILLGPGIRRSLNEEYKEAKALRGVVTSLPTPADDADPAEPSSPLKPVKTPKGKTPKSKPTSQSTSGDKKDDNYAAIVGRIDQFCRQHLNDEYALVCRELAQKLARKRPSPLQTGSPAVWASGIVRAIGLVNFLHDKSQRPTMRAADIDAAFGVAESSGAAKSAAIRKMFKIRQFDPRWTLPSKLDDNPLIWMLTVNGLIVDVRREPREVQEMAFEKGLIPYIPADRETDEES